MLSSLVIKASQLQLEHENDPRQKEGDLSISLLEDDHDKSQNDDCGPSADKSTGYVCVCACVCVYMYVCLHTMFEVNPV